MNNAIYKVPQAINEPLLNYAPGSPERETLKATLRKMRGEVMDIPMYIGGKEIRTGKKVRMAPPHDHGHTLAHFHAGDKTHVEMAIETALNAKEQWANFSWEHRASIFLKAAELLSGPYRAMINAATMLGQSKNVFQAEVDSA